MALLSSYCSQVVWLGKEHCKATWQPVASIPPSIVKEYEHRLKPEASVQSVTYGGQTNHTLRVCTDDVSPPKLKKTKVTENRYVCTCICFYVHCTYMYTCICVLAVYAHVHKHVEQSEHAKAFVLITMQSQILV